MLTYAVPYRGEFGNLLIIGEAGLAFMELMIDKGMVDPEEMEKAYFWRVKTGLLDGKFDRQIQSATREDRIFKLDLESDNRRFVARFKSFHKNTTGEIEVPLHQDFIDAYLFDYDGGVASINDTVDDPESFLGILALCVVVRGKEYTVIATGTLEYACWRHIKHDDSVKMISNHPKVDKYYENLTDRLVRGRKKDSPSPEEYIGKDVTQN